jgi:lysophospholipase L1-like esterase
MIIMLLLPTISWGQNDSKNLETMDSKKEIKYLALGDSYTIGQSVKISERYPVLLAESLNKLDYNVNPPDIIAKTGWTTDELMEALEGQEVQNDYTIVTLLIGVNNQYRGRDIEEFRVQFIELLEMSIKYAKGDSANVIVLSIPDWSVVPFAKDRNRRKISREIDQFNTIKKEETQKRNVAFVDITPISRKAKSNLSYVAGDDLHFSGRMHQLWVDEIIRTNF